MEQRPGQLVEPTERGTYGLGGSDILKYGWTLVIAVIARVLSLSQYELGIRPEHPLFHYSLRVVNKDI